MFDSMGAELPALTTFMLNLSNFVTSMTFAIGAPDNCCWPVFVRGYYSSKKADLLWIPMSQDSALRRPAASIRNGRNVRHTFHLVNSGIPIVEGIDRCISASSNELIRQTLRQSILLVTQGKNSITPWDEAMCSRSS